LNAVAGLTVCDPTAAREMCLQLADFFRSTVSLGARNTVTLREELALVRSFLAIEKVRFGARIAVEEDVEEAVLACTVPPLLLHPLVENAVTHGIATLLDGGTVRIVARGGAERVVIEVENPRDRDATAKRGAGVGLANVRQRLAQHYGGDAWLSVREEPDLFRVTLSLPASGPSAQASGGAQ
jgi:LytS/YehU family sensor histidine kinase